MVIKLIIGTIVLLLLVFIWSCCKIASISDKYVEDETNEEDV